MSDLERSHSASQERKVTISEDASPPHRVGRDRDNHESPGRNNKPAKRSYSRSPSAGRSRKMSYRDREERDRSDRNDRRYRSRSRSRSAKRYRNSRYSHSRSRSHSRGRYGRRERSHSRSPMSSRRRHVGTRENPIPSKCLGVFGLSINTTDSEIMHLFSKYGPVERVQVVIDAKTGQSRGFCFVYFLSTEDAKVAKDQCNGIKLGGKNIRVDYSITQRAHTPTPGIYMGKPTYTSRMGWGDRRGGDRRGDDYYGGGGGGGGGGYRGYRDSRRSPSPYYSSSSSRRRRYERSRSRSYSPRDYSSRSYRY